MRNKVYSEDSGLNVEVNRMQKNVWSWALAGSSLFNAAAYLLVVSGIDGNGWISTGVLVIYCIMETIPGVFLIGGFFYMRSRKEKLLQKNDRPLYIDDDVYWKNGWYSNPNDKRLMVSGLGVLMELHDKYGETCGEDLYVPGYCVRGSMSGMGVRRDVED